MEVSINGRERFCKDCNIPLRLFQDPYFEDRLQLYDVFFGTLEKWDIFKRELKKYKQEQDYFEEYNLVKDKAIESIKESKAYQHFNKEDMNCFNNLNKGFSSKDIFKTSNDGRIFIGIDMKKANFSALSYYNPAIFYYAQTWEDFIGLFTSNIHIIHSKYIRQVILGNCNPKRHITYEKYLMDLLLTNLLDKIEKQLVVFFSNDEIILDITERDRAKILQIVLSITENYHIPLKVEIFCLKRILGTTGYIKQPVGQDTNKMPQLKCLDSYMYPFVLRKYLGEHITENDKIFFYEGKLAQFIDVPEIVIPT